MKQRIYVAIDLKSFYASVECRERGLDPLDTNLVVADESRTDKTICLAVSPSLKSYGIPGRPRLFEVVQQVKEANVGRMYSAPGHNWLGNLASCQSLIQTHRWRLTTLLHRLGWRTTCNTVRAFMTSTSSTLHLRISSCIPSTKCSWM